MIQQDPGAGATISLDRAGPAVPAGEQLRHGARRDRDQLANAEYALKEEGFTNSNWLRLLRLVPDRRDVLSESPAGGTSYGTSQPVSIKLQANNC